MPPTYHIIVVADIASNGDFGTPEALAQVISDAFLARKGVWRFDYVPDKAPAPVPVAAPAQPPAPAPAAAHSWRVKVNAAFVRSGPGSSYGVAGTMTQGNTLAELGQQNGWVRFDKGWIFSGLLEEINGR